MAYTFWTKEDEEILKQYVGKIPYKRIGEMFSPPKTEVSVNKKALKLNLASDLRCPRKYFHNENYWDAPNLENSYWAGFIAADGCIKNKNKQLTIETVGDDEHLELMAKHLGYTGGLYRYARQTSLSPHPQSVARLEINCSLDYTRKLFENFGIRSQKTKRIEPPNLNGELFFAYLKGYIDGDGCIELTKRNAARIRIWSSSENILSVFKKKIEEEITKGWFYKKRDKEFIHSNTCTGISYQGLRAAILFDYLAGLDTPNLTRKWKKLNVLEYVREQKLKYPDKFLTHIPNSPISV